MHLIDLSKKSPIILSSLFQVNNAIIISHFSKLVHVKITHPDISLPSFAGVFLLFFYSHTIPWVSTLIICLGFTIVQHVIRVCIGGERGRTVPSRNWKICCIKLVFLSQQYSLVEEAELPEICIRKLRKVNFPLRFYLKSLENALFVETPKIFKSVFIIFLCLMEAIK